MFDWLKKLKEHHGRYHSGRSSGEDMKLRPRIITHVWATGNELERLLKGSCIDLTSTTGDKVELHRVGGQADVDKALLKAFGQAYMDKRAREKQRNTS